MPADHLLGKEGSAFVIAQTRLGGGRVHHAMRTVAQLGKGTYVYTGLAFFRQLPNGVSGAYRLFANLLALRSNRAGSPAGR